MPFCAIIYRRYLFKPFGESWGVFVPRNRNNVLSGLPIINYKSNFSSRLAVLEEVYPTTYNQMKFFIGDEDEYDTDRDYCIALDESFNIVTGNITDIPTPTYDLDYILSNTVNKISV